MRFPRNTKIFRGQLDFAPFAGVVFLLVIFLVLNSAWVFVPGVPIQLPETSSLPGLNWPTAVVVVDESGQYYFDNQVIDEARLVERLRELAAGGPSPVRPGNALSPQQTVPREPLTLVVKADAKVQYKVLSRLWLLAREAGITNVLQATQSALVPVATRASP